MTSSANSTALDVITANELSPEQSGESSVLRQHLAKSNINLDDAMKDPVKAKLIQKMNAKSSNVQQCYDIFKECYKTAMKQTFVSEIVNGEIIETKPDNIMVDEPIEEQYKINEEHFARFSQFCTKKLYKYQADAIKKLRELELRGYHVNEKFNTKVISNGWLLSLPIGSGKSLVFQFLALFYRDVPSHPIIVSRDGRNVPDFDQAELKMYPFYYENCGYVEGEANGIITLEDYRQRRCTVILTHQHLIGQMKEYFTTDFPKISSVTNIQYALDFHDIQDVEKADIIVIAATCANVNILVAMSYELPFMRVIIDDYTSMPSIDAFRQIRASSTIFVSGSGFNRKESDIPASYYTLKYMPVPKITLVGKPEETFEGIFRDSIATMKLMGSNCQFSQYKFVQECEEYCRLGFKANPIDVYPILATEPLLHNYISLMFILKNYDRLKSAIMAVEHDLVTINPKTNKPYLDKDRLKYYYQWKEMLSDVKRKPPPTKTIKEQFKDKDGQTKIVSRTVYDPPSLNPLYLKLYCDPTVGNGINASTIPDATCLVCRKSQIEHSGYGMIASCCGAFYCSSCLNESCTKTIVNSNTGEQIEDKNNYYCCCCRHKNPKYYMNVSKKKDTSVYSFSLLPDNYETKDIENRAIFDYYFYMFLHGFVPIKFTGKALNIYNDISQGAIDSKCFSLKQIPILDKILPKDQLAILALTNINTALYRLKILPRRNSIIMFYACPNYMQERVKFFYDEIVNKNNPNTAFDVTIGGKPSKMQPIGQSRIVFKDDIGSLIGLHDNIIAIIVWSQPGTFCQDIVDQIAGRILRINNYNNPLSFYIETSSIAFE